jgi:toxin ParE1/3/4
MANKKQIWLLRIAEQDLAEIIDYIAMDNLPAAAAFLTKMETMLERLTEFPFLGSEAREVELRQLGYRYLVLENYLIFYTIQSDNVLVHRILSGARDYLRILK